jgi:heme/copper-type cytochrome/quinol oxidase subunit 2
MNDDALSNVMFWVGLMFALTPLLVIALVVFTTRRLRRRRREAESSEVPQ